MSPTIAQIDNLTISELVGDRRKSLDTIAELYRALMPQYAHNIPRLREIVHRPFDADPDLYQHVWLAEVDGQTAGMILFEYATKRDLGLGIGLAIKRPYRALRFGAYGRLAEMLIKRALTQLRSDATHAGRPLPLGLAVEVTLPKLIPRYENYGYVNLPVRYYEPSGNLGNADTEAGLEALGFHLRHLGIFPLLESFDASDTEVWERIVYTFYIDHYGIPETHLALRIALESIRTTRQKRGK